MQDDGTDWDFFLAHAGPDAAVAEVLYEHLCKESRVFLDSRCLKLGDDWDATLATAQRSALISVVLISRNTAGAYYQREEVAAAIALARESSDRHRVVPVYLNIDATQAGVPYGLRLKHGISLAGEDLSHAAARLLDLRRSLRAGPAGAVQRKKQRTSGGRGDVKTPKAVVAEPAPRVESPEGLFAEGEALYLKEDFAGAYERFLHAAELGHLTAQFALGHMHWEGKGCWQDYAAAARWFRHAAERGDANAQFLLSAEYRRRYLHDQWYDPEDLRQHIRFLSQAAEQGLARAQCGLGVRYRMGIPRGANLGSSHKANDTGLPCDYAEAMKWYLQSAERGYAPAMGNIAELYEKGLGVIEDPVKAAYWERKAKEQYSRDRARPSQPPWYEKPVK